MLCKLCCVPFCVHIVCDTLWYGLILFLCHLSLFGNGKGGDMDYVCKYHICFHDICFMQGENIYIYMLYLLYLFSAGGIFAYTICDHQKGGECWNLDFDYNKLMTIYIYILAFVMQVHWSSNWSDIIEFLQHKMLHEYLLFRVIFLHFLADCKSLEIHTHIVIKSTSPLYNRLIFYVVKQYS